MERPKRKRNRLKEYDYSQNGCYFITVCTAGKEKLFWNDWVGADSIRPEGPPLGPLGLLVEEKIREIPVHYPQIVLENYVVMPNHIHLLLTIGGPGGRMISAPTKGISTIVGQMKRAVSKAVGRPIWQKSYYDHIVRSEQDFLDIWNYITGNPSKWSDDIYYEP